MITEEQIQECQDLALKNDSVKALLEAFLIYHESPYSDIYLSGFEMIDSWRDEIKQNASSIKIMSTDDKKFERAFAIMKSLSSLVESLDEIRGKMLPKQREDVDMARKHKKSDGKVHV
jgi:hypothetical protein